MASGGSAMGRPGEYGRYGKPPDSFLADYKAAVDFMAEHGVNGIVIWGFLRDAHGGVAAAQELCRYATERGVRILPGVGTSGYGGYYYEGSNRYNAKTWITEHPELRSVNKDGKSIRSPCPSKKGNQDHERVHVVSQIAAPLAFSQLFCSRLDESGLEFAHSASFPLEVDPVHEADHFRTLLEETEVGLDGLTQ